MRAALDKQTGLRPGRRLSHVFVCYLPANVYPKPLMVTDAALNIAPDLETKQQHQPASPGAHRRAGSADPEGRRVLARASGRRAPDPRLDVGMTRYARLLDPALYPGTSSTTEVHMTRYARILDRGSPGSLLDRGFGVHPGQRVN